MNKTCYVAGFINFQAFPDFLNLSESCGEDNASLLWKLRQTALKLTPKGLD